MTCRSQLTQAKVIEHNARDFRVVIDGKEVTKHETRREAESFARGWNNVKP